jgi:hypothetical protein
MLLAGSEAYTAALIFHNPTKAALKSNVPRAETIYDDFSARFFKGKLATGLFDDVIKFSNINQTSRALEVGIGTGQATLPFLKLNCHVTAIELGDELTYPKVYRLY